MGKPQRKYEKEYEVQAVKLAKEIGIEKAGQELGVPKGTLSGWLKAVREGRLDAGPGSHTPETAMSLAEEMAALRKQVKAQEREIRRLKEEKQGCKTGVAGGKKIRLHIPSWNRLKLKSSSSRNLKHYNRGGGKHFNVLPPPNTL